MNFVIQMPCWVNVDEEIASLFCTVVGNLQPILATLVQRMTTLSLEQIDINDLIENLDQDIQNVEQNIDFTQFSDSEITYALDSVAPPITPTEIETIFVKAILSIAENP